MSTEHFQKKRMIHENSIARNRINYSSYTRKGVQGGGGMVVRLVRIAECMRAEMNEETIFWMPQKI